MNKENYRIETVSGQFVDVTNPTPETILLDDIAWALSRMARFCGHTVTAIPYNVCQHSVFVAKMVLEAGGTNDMARFALFHDAAEYVTGDFPSPLKRVPDLRPVIKQIEDRLLHVIFEKFCGRQPFDAEWKVVKDYDLIAQQIEAHAFMFSRGANWNFPEPHPSLIDYQSFPAPKTAIESYADFIQMEKDWR